MHQRTSSSRSRPPRKEKIYRNSKEDLDKVRPVTLLGNGNSFHRSLSEFVKPGGGGGSVSSGCRRDSVGNDKSRSHSRDGDGNRTSISDRDDNFVRNRQDESLWWTTGHNLKESGAEGNMKSYSNQNNNSRELKDKRMDYSHGFIDDNRLSKLINRVQRDDDYDRRILACKQLKDFLLQNENWKSINKNADKLLSILESLLMEKASSEVKRQIVINMGIIGYVKTLECQNNRYFEWVFNKCSTATNDEMRIHLLNCIVETLKTDGNKHKMDQVMPSLMNSVQTVLENAEVSQVLIAIVDIILQIANKYPQVFGQHFRDTVDILVGWHIDTAQSSLLTQYTSDALVSFNRFWVSDISFSTTLLGQFLEDMEAYSEELNSGSLSIDEHHDKLIGCAAKIASLIKVYTTVVLSLGDYYDPEKTNAITYEFISEHASRMLKSAIISADSLPTESMLIAVNDSIALQLSFLKIQSCSLVSSVMTFLDKQSSLKQPLSVAHLTSLLNLLNTMVIEVNSQLPLPCLEQIIGTNSPFSKLRFHSSRQIRQQCLLLYRTMFTFKSVPLLEEAYRLVVGEIHSAFHTILDWDLALPLADYKFHHNIEAESVIVFSLCTLAELGNAKSSILGMWALDPSIFDLLSQRLRPTDLILAEKFPAIHYAILFTLYSHCSRYGNFLLSSCLLNVATPKSLGNAVGSSSNSDAASATITSSSSLSTTTTTESMTTSGHFETVITVLNKTLSLPSSSFGVCSLCLKWSQEIISNVQPFLQTVCNSLNFMTFIQMIISTAYSNDKHISKAACSCLLLLFRQPSKLKPVILQKCFEVCLLKITDINNCVREMFLKLLCHLPLDIATSQLKSINSLNFRSQLRGNQVDRISNLENVWVARRHFISRNPLVTFHSHNFRSVMAFILQGVQLELVEMFHTCQRIEKLKNDDIEINEMTMNNEALLWFWATWEAAHFCILTKLRTSFGKPQETFTTIEGSVKSLLLEAKMINCDDSSEHKIDFEAISQTHLRAKLLLDFVEHLEKLMYNAYEGCATSLPGAPKAVKTFFRTNKATCLEWLTRIRMAVLLLALHMGNPAMAVRQGYQLLNDMKDMSATRGAEFERVVMNVVHALIDLHCPDAILGLYVWCKETIGRKFTWMKAAIEQASRRYETAAHEFVCLIKKHQNTAGKAPRSSPIASPPPEDTSENKLKLCSAKQSHSAHSENQDEPDLPILTFMSNQVVECYRRLNNWADLVKWVVSQQQVAHEQNGSVTTPRFETSADLTYLTTLTKFEELDVSALKTDSFIHNVKSDETLQKLMIPFPQRVLQEADAALMSAALKWDSSGKSTDSRKKISQYLSNACQCTVGAVRVAAMDWPIVLPPEHVALYQTTVALMSCLVKEKKNYTIPLSSNLELDLISSDCGTWNQAIRWSKYMEFVNSNNNEHGPHSDVLDNLQLTVSRLARKHRNLKLSQKLLVQHMKRNIDFDWRSMQTSLEARNNLMWEVLKQTQTAESTLAISSIQREGAKLLHSLGQSQPAIDVLLHMIRCSIDIKEELNVDPNVSVKNLSARSLLTLVKWMQADGSLYSDSVRKLIALVSSQDESHKLDKCFSLKYLAEADTMNGDSEDEGQSSSCCVNESTIASPTLLVPEREEAFGRLLYLSTSQSPFLAKSWSCFASWLYKWGRKAVDVASEKSVDLTPEEWNLLMSLLPKDTPENEIDAIMQILSRTYSVPEAEFMDSYCDGVETIRRQLLAISPRLSSESLDGLVAVWKGVVDRIYSFYKLSAEAYFKCLNLNEMMNTNEQCEDGNIIATLRLLRLVVKHASELRQVLEEGLANTPTAPWKGIIPQLFARLNHPESYVRQSISDLLCRVAHAAPHLIVFPAVVGSTAAHREIKDGIGLLGQYLSQPSDDGLDDRIEDISPDGDVTPVVSSSEEDEQKEMLMRNCFAAMVETLSKQDPRTISEVKTLVHELRRITLLWDELWLGTLNQYHADFNRKISQLESEVKKVTSNPALTNDEKRVIILKKHTTILKPTLFVLEQLDQITSQPPETPHEKWFQDTFQKLIEDVINRLHNPVDPAMPQASWQLYKQLVHALQHRAQKRSSLALNMETVSPILATLRSTVVCMPGAHVKGDQIVTIEYIDNSIAILPTKTKPKKLIFHGSDGFKYVYLFKGLEDLHLDERIMQFISIINSMFVRNRRQGKFVYHARHYSVTPLGPRSGLIQWVDGATPLFGLYKRWQQREVAALALKSSSGTGSMNPNIAATTMRPSEIYYNKLTPLLKEKGIVNLDVRKDWPISVLRQVLLELMEETPKDLLAKELWCSSGTAMEWWKITETYSQSTAVMSMIGYIIGLGDRHLDNVLVDLATGEVVHIDYNVCFEKGRNLRVPEKVPFRMTPNIETALGVTGAEGIFRVSCEQVLKTMRRGRETLLTLLEAFVYDPLIDWTPGGEGGYTGAVYGGGQLVGMETRQSKLDMEQEITYSMFSIRITEMKAEWTKNKEELLESLPNLEKFFRHWMESQKKLLEEEEALQAHHQEMAYLKEAEANPAHSLYSLPQRYTEYTVVKNSLQVVKKAAQEKLNECEKWHSIHKVSMCAVTAGPELVRWCNEATKVIDFSISSFAPVIDFLRTAGQSQLLAQCEQADSELDNLLHQHQGILRSCLDTLNTYATVAIQYPASYLELNRCFKWQKWLAELNNNFTVSECQKIIEKFHLEYGNDRLTQTCMNTTQTVLTVEYQLQSLITTTNSRLLKLYERIRMENLDKVPLLLSNLDESKNAIYEFINACPKSGSISLACVLLTALCSLNKRCLMMEGAAFAAGDRLVDLTSREGDWFLDEVFSISSNIMQLLTLLKTNCQFIDGDILKAIDGVAAVHRVIASLEDLHLNFLTIILPEALKHIQSREKTVVHALQSLTSVISNVGCPLDTLISQLELQVRSVIMEMDSPESKATIIVSHIRNKFNSLVKDATNENSGLSSGQMLFMGFDGLFTKLEQDFLEALDIMKLLVLPACWRKVDLVKESKNLLAPVFLEPALTILKDIFFLKRLQAMQDFFTLSQHQARALLTILKEENYVQSYGAVYEDDHLTRPIKKFIADFVNKQLLGLLSQSLSYVVCLLVRVCGVNVTAEIELRDVGAENKVSLEELCRKAIDMSLKEDALKANQLSQASSLASAYEAAWKKQDIARRLDQNILMLKSSLQRVQLQLASHQWLHEDILLSSNVLHNLATPTRATVMSEMRKTMQLLLSIESNLNVSRDRFVNLVSSVEQRLKWAVGANPSVTAILEEFEQSVAVKNDMISNFTKIGGEVTTTCSTILHCEALRTRTSEAISSDAAFMQLINRCLDSCLLAENCTMDVNPLEERLVAMKPLNGQMVTKEWISLVTEDVTNASNEVQGQLAHRKVDMFCRWDCIKNQVMCIRSELTTHHHLMSDIRVILKSMAKYEDQEPNCCVHGVKRYLQLYKSYSEKLSNFIREVLTEEMSIERAEELLDDMRLLEQQTHDIYDELLQFAVTLTDDDSNDGNSTSNNNVLDPKMQTKEDGTLRSASSPRKHLSVLRSELFSGTSPSSQNVNKASGTLRKNTVTRDPRTGKAIQERNSYAVSVWRRVKMKLDGRDPDGGRRSSVAEQVDFVLQEATNVDNLAVLYEGWTPWV